ncbi:DUF5696 domain-containing protein [Paenibacillus sp. GCM10027626]|uniref:DUF5696 domain-containing protein n=1 Tax=Paenibacillus sp. GCM10027626 TaxID=3273411 RepID=UPI00363B5A51
MSKSALLRKAKVVGALAAVVAVLFAFRLLIAGEAKIPVSGETGDEAIHAMVTNDTLSKIEGSGLVKAAENDKLILSIDTKDGNIEVLDKAGHSIWRSRPTPEEVERDTSNNLWKNNLQSPIIVEYVKDYSETIPNYANVFTQNTKVGIFRLKGGARAFYDFESLGIQIAVDYYLREDHLEVDVPRYMIREPDDSKVAGQVSTEAAAGKTRKIVGYNVLPFFGAAQKDSVRQGYLMVPDGPGALIRFDGHKKYNLAFSGRVYGSDLSYANQFDSSLRADLAQSMVVYPAFGINRGDASMLAVIHSGESEAEIVGNPAGVNTSFYSAYPHFIYREKYKKLTDLTGAGVYLYTEFPVSVSSNIRYYFMNGAKSNYAGMAEAYRNYLMHDKGLARLPKLTGDLPLELRIMGGAEATGFLKPSFIPMTTFEQAADILGYFRDNGVRSMTAVYEGWAKRGTSVEYPDRFPAEDRLGGMSGLKALTDQAHQIGYRLLLADDNMRARTGKGVSERSDIVRNILNAPLDIGDGTREQVLNAAAIARTLDDSIPRYRELNVDGIQENGMNLLNSDFNASSPMNREQTKRSYESFISRMVKELGAVRLERGLAYQLVSGVSVENIAADYSFSPIVDENVPFYPMALHGLVDYVSMPYNLMDEPDKELLKAIEYGANISFEVTAEPTERLIDAETELYSSEFEVWKQDILRLYGKVKEALGGVSDSFIIAHEQLARDVYLTVYDNGTRVVCNYTDAPYAYQGKSAQPMDFIVMKGGDGD